MCPRGYVITKISAELLLYNNNDNNNNDVNDNDKVDAAVDDVKEAVPDDDLVNEDLPYQFQKTENYDNGATTEADDGDGDNGDGDTNGNNNDYDDHSSKLTTTTSAPKRSIIQFTLS